jgi:hypothetical protein
MSVERGTTPMPCRLDGIVGPARTEGPKVGDVRCDPRPATYSDREKRRSGGPNHVPFHE